MKFTGRYINLAASHDRREQIEAQLDALGVRDRYERFPAIEGRPPEMKSSPLNDGEVGCFLSHRNCIAEGGDGAHIHVIEDDIVLSPQAFGILDSIDDDPIDACDILFTEVSVPVDMQSIYTLMEFYRQSGMPQRLGQEPDMRRPAFMLYPDLKFIAFGCAASYIVNRRSTGKIVGLLDQELSRGLHHPIDMTYRLLARNGEITARCTMPFLTMVRHESSDASTVSGRRTDPASAAAINLLSSYFYLGKDHRELNGVAEELASGLEDPSYLDPILGALRFIFSEKYRNL